MLNFDFLKKGLGIVSDHNLYMIFREKYFSCYFLLTDQNSLPLLLEILVSVCIEKFFPCFDVIIFENKLIFLIKSFYYMTKKSRQNLNILRPKRAFKLK